jgi:hypothetical protein
MQKRIGRHSTRDRVDSPRPSQSVIFSTDRSRSTPHKEATIRSTISCLDACRYAMLCYAMQRSDSFTPKPACYRCSVRRHIKSTHNRLISSTFSPFFSFHIQPKENERDENLLARAVFNAHDRSSIFV